MSGPIDLPPSGAAEAPPWHWLFADEAGVVMSGPDVAFESQQAAEDWLGAQFDELAAAGIAAVSLLDGERSAYGPMSLAPGPPRS